MRQLCFKTTRQRNSCCRIAAEARCIAAVAPQLPPDRITCPVCGRTAAPAASPNPGRFPGRVATHINVTAIFWIIISAGHVMMGGLDYLLGRAFTQTSPGLGLNLPILLPALFMSHASYELAYGVAGGLCAWALIARLPLARQAIISLSVLSLLTGAFGVVLGAYTLWIMLAPVRGKSTNS